MWTFSSTSSMTPLTRPSDSARITNISTSKITTIKYQLRSSIVMSQHLLTLFTQVCLFRNFAKGNGTVIGGANKCHLHHAHEAHLFHQLFRVCLVNDTINIHYESYTMWKLHKNTNCENYTLRKLQIVKITQRYILRKLHKNMHYENYTLWKLHIVKITHHLNYA